MKGSNYTGTPYIKVGCGTGVSVVSELPVLGGAINTIPALSNVFGNELQTSLVFTEKFTVYPCKARCP